MIQTNISPTVAITINLTICWQRSMRGPFDEVVRRQEIEDKRLAREMRKYEISHAMGTKPCS